MRPETTAILARLQALTPGASQTRSKAPGRVGPRLDAAGADEFPIVAYSGHGAWITSYDNRALWGERKYLDFIGANAAIPLGYGEPRVTEAVQRVITAPLLSLPTTAEGDVAEMLCAHVNSDHDVPWAEQVRFVRTGSEACTAALQIARAATGRFGVWVGDWAYHGWHAWAALRRPMELVHQYALNDYRAIDYLPRAPVLPAAIFFEPPRWIDVDPAWLAQLRETCTRLGVPLVFDEMVMGFRIAKSGGSGFYKIRPDLACYGKALGNGFAIAAVVGGRTLMQHAVQTVSSTHGGERIGLAAAEAVLDIYAAEDVCGALKARGDLFRETYSGRHTAPTQALQGHAAHFRIAWASPAQADAVLAQAASECVLFHRDANNISVAMTEDDVRRGARVLADAVRATAVEA